MSAAHALSNVIPLSRARDARAVAEAAASIDALVPDRPSGTRRARALKGISDREFDKVMTQALTMAKSGDWTEATPRHFVALYAWCHAKVYGVAPAELSPVARMRAAFKASQLLKREFVRAGEDAPDLAAFAGFVRWVWTREAVREKKRVAEGREPNFLIGWGWMFGGALLTQYRVAAHREQR